MDPQRRIPKFEIDDVDDPVQGAAGSALRAHFAREYEKCGLAGRDMLSGSAFTKVY